MKTPFKTIKDADPQAAARLLEITGIVFAAARGELTAWCRRVGVSMDEIDAIVRDYRTDVDHGRRSANFDYW